LKFLREVRCSWCFGRAKKTRNERRNYETGKTDDIRADEPMRHRRRGVTMSVIVARLVHEAVRKVTATPKAEAWAARRLAVNTARRARVDAAVRAGRDRKPGWELTKRFAGKGDSRRGA